jgi:hypothetical protein
VVSRRQIAQTLVRSLSSPAAIRKTFELVAEHGPATTNFDAAFARLDADPASSVDGVRDVANLPASAEPATVRDDLQREVDRGISLSRAAPSQRTYQRTDNAATSTWK